MNDPKNSDFTMKRFILFAALLAGGFAASAQEAIWGGGEVVSPENLPDNRVTIRILAPHARKVVVTGD